jgi:diguanylate cyclase (GGDEF)-like protein/PAS domain S-box-containing protein
VSFRDLSLRKKLVVVIMAATLPALLLGGSVVVTYQVAFARRAMAEQLDTLAQIVGSNCTAALSFDKSGTAEEILAALRSEPDVVAAAVYRQDGRQFASFARPGIPMGIPTSAPATGTDFGPRRLSVSRSITLGGEALGTISLWASYERVELQLRSFLRMSAIVTTLALLAALFLAVRLQRLISEPVNRLVRTADSITERQDYSLRAERTGRDEVGRLVDSFNRMVAEIEQGAAALRHSEERYALAAQAANDGLWAWDFVTERLFLSPRWKEILGNGLDELPDVVESWFSRIHPEDVTQVQRQLDLHLEGRTSCFECEHRILHRDGEYRWVLNRGLAVFDNNKRAVRMAGSMADITDRKQAEEKLVHDALHDALSGLPNRVLFRDRLEHVLGRDRRGMACAFAVLYLDLDRFKIINDSLGHDAGDRLLSEIGRRLAEIVRPGDTAARLGGDEFAVLLEDLDCRASAIGIARRIIEGLTRSVTIGGEAVHTRPSIGIAFADAGASKAEELIRSADLAMYAAKRRGTGVEVYDRGMHAEVVGKMRVEAELHTAVERHQLFLCYQPIFSLRSGRLAGLEALMRWRHPERGVVSPAEFIPALEETRLIVPVTHWLIEEVLRHMQEWGRPRAGTKPLFVTINVSAVSFLHSNLVDDIKGALGRAQLGPGSLGIELTESALMDDPAVAERQLAALRGMGVYTIIDDFGTGYSSLAYLSRLPFDKIKIDRSFVAGMGGPQDSLGIVRAIVALAHDLNKELVAEGVETQVQLHTLTALGCEFGQGFLLGRPVVEAQARELVAPHLAHRAEEHGPRSDGLPRST